MGIALVEGAYIEACNLAVDYPAALTSAQWNDLIRQLPTARLTHLANECLSVFNSEQLDFLVENVDLAIFSRWVPTKLIFFDLNQIQRIVERCNGVALEQFAKYFFLLYVEAADNPLKIDEADQIFDTMIRRFNPQALLRLNGSSSYFTPEQNEKIKLAVNGYTNSSESTQRAVAT